MILHYDYMASKAYCAQIGLIWLGDSFVQSADQDAFNAGFTQAQVDLAMRHHLWNVRLQFSPRRYSWPQRLLIAAHFVFNFKKW